MHRRRLSHNNLYLCAIFQIYHHFSDVLPVHRGKNQMKRNWRQLEAIAELKMQMREQSSTTEKNKTKKAVNETFPLNLNRNERIYILFASLNIWVCSGV